MVVPHNFKNLSVDVLMHFGLIVLALFMILPFIWMLSTSFKPADEIFASPPIIISPNMSLDGYDYILNEGGALRSVWNTFFMATSFTVLSLFFCSMGGFGFAKYRFPGRKVLFMFLVLTMMIPGAVTIVPTYVMMTKLDWINTFLPLIIPGAANAFGIFFMRQYISGISDELLDAARIDGCGEFGVFRRIILPIIVPGLTSLGLIFYLWSWNNYLGPLIYLKAPELFTLPLKMMTFSGPPGYSSYREMMGLSVLSVLPLLILFLAMQRRFIEGITSGAVKG